MIIFKLKVDEVIYKFEQCQKTLLELGQMQQMIYILNCLLIINWQFYEEITLFEFVKLIEIFEKLKSLILDMIIIKLDCTSTII